MRKRRILFPVILLGIFSAGLSGCDTAPKTFTITWQNYDGTVLEVDNDVPLGTLPTYDGETPVRFDDSQFIYTFGGWSPSITAASKDQTYTAEYQETT